MTNPAHRDLDQLLAAWAQAQRLPDADAERIRQAIIPPVPALEASWWSEFNSKLSTAIARATPYPPRRRRSALKKLLRPQHTPPQAGHESRGEAADFCLGSSSDTLPDQIAHTVNAL
jgi:hypothetical protein